MFRTLSLVLLVFIVGCGSAQNIPVGLGHVGSGLSRISSDVDSASLSITRAKPGASAVGAAHLDSAASDLSDAQKQVTVTEKAFEDATEAAGKLTTQNIELADQVKTWKSGWFGGLFYFWRKVIIISGLSIWIAGNILGTWLKAVNPLGVVGRAIRLALPFMNISAWIGSALSSKTAVVVEKPVQ